MTCSTCKHWKIIPTTGSTRGDEGMKALGYRNCAGDVRKLRMEYRFLHGDAKSCENYDKKKV